MLKSVHGKIQIRESCHNCAFRRFGWKDDHGWDTCDEVCQIGPIGTLLFCIHGMTPKQVSEKLQNLCCHRWKSLEVSAK